jgi:hypothetical protein
MVEIFQRRHFNWIADVLGEIDISDNDLEYVIERLKYTNNNFNVNRFKEAVKANKIN